MASSGSSNTAVWVVVIILVFVGIVLVAVKSGDDGKPAGPTEPQPTGLEQMLNNQIGPENSKFDGEPTPKPAPAPEPAPDPAPEEAPDAE